MQEREREKKYRDRHFAGFFFDICDIGKKEKRSALAVIGRGPYSVQERERVREREGETEKETEKYRDWHLLFRPWAIVYKKRETEIRNIKIG